MNLISADIVTSKNDALWADVSGLVTETGARPVLVLAAAYEEGSPEEAQLKKMLEACKLTPEQYHIVCLAEGQQAAWHQLRDLLEPKIIFLVGVMPAQLGISALFALNAPNNFNDCIWLPTLNVKDLERDPAIKKQLWNNGMSPIFIQKKYGHL